MSLWDCDRSEKSDTDDVFIEMMRIREESKNNRPSHTWSKRLSPRQRLNKLNKQFSKLDLNDYLCTYTDMSSKCEYAIPSQSEFEAIFVDMDKNTPESREINCSCCGYDTCRDMAIAIHNGFNHKDNCIYYLKSQVETEKENALLLADKVKEEKMLFLSREKIL